MGDKSKIEWTDATWNPVTGCTKVSAGCKNCYMFREYPRLAKLGAKGYVGGRPDQVRLWPDRLDQPLRWRHPRKIFVNSMSDFFHDKVPADFIDRMFAVMALSHQHIFQILTKRPERMLSYLSHENGIAQDGRVEWWSATARRMAKAAESFSVGRGRYYGTFEFPLRNVWLGVSVEDQDSADERIPLLLETPAAVRFVSYEPALRPVDFSAWLLDSFVPAPNVDPVITPHFDWVIAGGESGPNARPSRPDWFRAVRDHCQAAGVPFFFKQWGEWLPGGQDSPNEINCMDTPVRIGKKRAGRLLDGREWNEFPQESENAEILR